MTLRVIQWATGGVGRAAMEGVIEHPELELVGAWVHSHAKEGVDLGTLLGRGPIGVTATGDVATLLATEADCVLYSPFMADPSVVVAILGSGKNVVTPLGWFYPPNDERARMDTIAKSAGVTLHGTGIHPGGITQRFPLMISALSGSITHVRAAGILRHSYVRGTRRSARLDAVRQDPGGGSHEHHDRRTGRWFSPVDLHGRSRAGLRCRATVAHHPRDGGGHRANLTRRSAPSRRGTVAAQRFQWEALVHGEPVVSAAVNWLMGEEDLDPAWRFGPGGERFEVEITGDPNCLTTFKKLHPESVEAGLARNPGIVATAMHCVNAIPYVCRAEPGLLTYLDLPLVAGRAAAGLGRGGRGVKRPSKP